MNCPDQDLCREIILHLATILMSEVKTKDFLVATRAVMEALWHSEEEEMMKWEFKML